MFDLTGKTALVTGATGGIGAEIARTLHAQGAHVVLSGTREAVLQDLAADARRARVSVAAANLSDPAAVDGLIGRAERPRRGSAGHPGGQCRDHPGRPADADEGRGLGDGHQGQSGKLFPAQPRGHARA